MVDINSAIAHSIIMHLKNNRITRTELAEGIGVTEQIANQILNGTRMASAAEIHRITDYLHISTQELLSIPKDAHDSNPVFALMEEVHSDTARQALAVADELADMIIFHARVRENAEAMMQTWEI